MTRILISSWISNRILTIEFGVYLFGIRIWKVMRACKLDKDVFTQEELNEEIKQLMR